MRSAFGRLLLLFGLIVVVFWTDGPSAPVIGSLAALRVLETSAAVASAPTDEAPAEPCAPASAVEQEEERSLEDGPFIHHEPLVHHPLSPELASRWAAPRVFSLHFPDDPPLSFDAEPATPPPRS